MQARHKNAEEIVLGFDYGMRRIGVALGNNVTGVAQALTTIQNLNTDHRFAQVQALIQEWTPKLLVVGLPLDAEGGEQKMSQLAKKFGNQLQGRFQLPVVWVDERYSTMAAEIAISSTAKQKIDIDAQAACIILQQYFDEHSFQLLNVKT